MRKSGYIILILFLLINSKSSLYSKILMKPYLQAVTHNNIYVLAESDSKDKISVHYGSDENANLLAYTESILETEENTYIHRIMLPDLKPNNIYYYKTSQSNQSTELASFRTAVPPGTPFRFAVMGDCRSNPKVHAKIAKLIQEKNPLFSVYTGDLSYDESYGSWKKEFFIPEQLELSSHVPFFNTIGNHESWSQNTKAFTHSPESNSKMMDYYSFDYGDIHFIVINSEQEIIKGTQQYNFIKNDLSSTNQKWKVAVFHKPAYCAGGHDENKNMIKLCNDLLEPNNVDIIFSGHSHFYQHNYVNGIHHFIIAGGGAPLYTPKKKSYVVKSRKIHHYGIFDVTPHSVKLTVYDLNDNVIDVVELKK